MTTDVNEINALVQKVSYEATLLSRGLSNLTKSPKVRITPLYLEQRLANANQLWTNYDQAVREVVLAIDSSVIDSIPCLKSSEYDKAQETFFEMVNWIDSKTVNHNGNDQRDSGSTPGGDQSNSRANLYDKDIIKPLSLDKFSGEGDYVESWLNFRDLFVSLIHDDRKLSPVSKLQYLKASVTGEASDLISSYVVSDVNYEPAWDLVKRVFDKKHVLIDIQLNKLLDLPVVTSESADGIKSLIYSTDRILKILKNSGLVIDEWDYLIIFMSVRKLPYETRALWEQEVSKKADLPKFDEFMKFMECRYRAILSLGSRALGTSSSVAIGSSVNNSRKNKSGTWASGELSCVMCKEKHFLDRCSKFIAMPNNARNDFVVKSRLCFCCLKGGHNSRSCRISQGCLHCNKSHHSLLHRPTTERWNSKDVSKSESAVRTGSQGVVLHTMLRERTEKIFATVLVNVESSDGQIVTLRAVLDPVSDASFITSRACKLLGKKLKGGVAQLTGLGGTVVGSSVGSVTLAFSSIYETDEVCRVTALVVQSVTNKQPPEGIAKLDNWEVLNGLRLADPMFRSRKQIDLLLDLEVYSSIIQKGLIRSPGFPNLHETKLGWIVSGVIGDDNEVKKLESDRINVLLTNAVLERQLEKFWEQEQVRAVKPVSEESVKCERFFVETTYRRDDGRFVVTLPMKYRLGEDVELGDSRRVASCRFKSLENKLVEGSQLREQYVKCIDEYFETDHIESVGLTSNKTFYIPHHAVFKPKFRVVFDASCRSNSKLSLNDCMYSGPKLQVNIWDVVMGWRKYKFCFQSDIEKMYRQVAVSEGDADLQRISWRRSLDDPIGEFRLTRLTFGVKAAPFLAIRVLHHIADLAGDKFPRAKDVIKNEFYVDDLRSGGDTVEEAIEVRTQVTEVLESARFPLRKWLANDSRVLEGVPIQHRDDQCESEISEDGEASTVRSLGLLWDPKSDVFRFKVKAFEKWKILTKRSLLSRIASLYDPMGWISPVVIKAKILMQSLWETDCDWDGVVSESIEKRWVEIENSLTYLNDVSIPRWMGLSKVIKSYQVHLFGDASETAYAAVAFLRVVDEYDQVFISQLSAKSRVAPLRAVTLPRLELCAAVLSVELCKSVRDPLKLDIEKCHFWSDSEIVLGWISQSSRKWSTFVANRVSTIQSESELSSWSYIKSKENPADCASRELLARSLIDHDLWWSGPRWLHCPEAEWPRYDKVFETDLELKSKAVMLTHVENDCSILLDCSTLKKATRVVALILSWKVPRLLRKSVVDFTDIKYALLAIVKRCQSDYFSAEMQLLRQEKGSGRCSRVSSSLIKLSPFIDSHGILRVGGRIRHANLPYDRRHPMILPKSSRLTQLVVEEAHLFTVHGSIQEGLNYVRLRFWVMGGRNTVQGILVNCVNCVRIKARLCTQYMADLPAVRVLNQGNVFVHVGLDYAGPIIYKASSLKKAARLKGYIALFVCMSTKAVNLQFVGDKTTDCFMKPFTRFTSIRGCPNTMYSDNERAFVGADRLIDRELQEVLKNVHTDAKGELANLGIGWEFNPPEAPHQGGIWESNIKATKRHLLASVGNSVLTFEEMSTVLSKIEACLNSRPLCPASEDPEDLEVITPGHFLVGRPLLSVPEADVTGLKDHVLSRWRFLKKLTQTFWKRWSEEYLQSLHRRVKWLHEGRQLLVGDLVLIKEELIHPLSWRRGRIIASIMGDDSRVRVVKIRTMSGILTRDVRKLCLLLPA